MRKLFTILYFIALLCSSSQASTPLSKTNIKLTATIIEWSCSVSTGSQGQTVNLGNWATKRFSETGDSTNAVEFNINLESCNSDTVSVTFSGTTDGDYLALDDSSTAGNVAVQILDSSKDTLPIGTESEAVSVDDSGNATFTFYANLIATAIPVTAGTVSASATFTVNYY